MYSRIPPKKFKLASFFIICIFLIMSCGTAQAITGQAPLLASLSLEQIDKELTLLFERILSWLSAASWLSKLKETWELNGFQLIMPFLLYGIFLYLLLRFRRFCKNYQNPTFFSRYRSLYVAFQLFYQSIPLFGSTGFLFFYAGSQGLFSSVPILRLLMDLLWVLLLSRWCLDFISSYHQIKHFPLAPQVVPRMGSLIIWIRSFALIHLVIAWIAGDRSAILLLGRMLLGIGLLGWYVFFLKACRKSAQELHTPLSSGQTISRVLGIGLGYIVAGGGLLLELIGYNRLGVFWLVSWGQTTAVFLWGGLCFFILREWYLHSQKISEAENEGDKISGNPFRWFCIWVCWLAWLVIFFIAIIAAWGGRQAVILGFLKAINTPFMMGNMRLSLPGFAYAFLILLLTHAAVRIWRIVFQNKVLSRSDIEAGLQESITSIAVYAFWVLGILLALRTVGISTTSLAVGLGALGIGLGFGLQNIFNNFISGIILLFERPIQVGDAVEVNGIWATVKKINVRATVVQTWDNASLIIPNSEFISAQVTNWSFKDMRLRRNIIVGVAYGSDVELVRKTLLEIAEKTPRILKNPKPDVLFSDFGDSALIFKLRIWTLVEGMFAVETDVRFEIDRLFRERQITIAFPQRDIHIRSTVQTDQAEEKPDIKP